MWCLTFLFWFYTESVFFYHGFTRGIMQGYSHEESLIYERPTLSPLRHCFPSGSPSESGIFRRYSTTCGKTWISFTPKSTFFESMRKWCKWGNSRAHEWTSIAQKRLNGDTHTVYEFQTLRFSHPPRTLSSRCCCGGVQPSRIYPSFRNFYFWGVTRISYAHILSPRAGLCCTRGERGTYRNRSTMMIAPHILTAR